MKKPLLAPAFCQVAWVVRDMAAAERFFVETMGVSRFMHMDNLAAKDTEGTYLGKPGNWVCNLHIAYAGDTQIELIQPVSGASMYQESLDRHGDAVQATWWRRPRCLPTAACQTRAHTCEKQGKSTHPQEKGPPNSYAEKPRPLTCDPSE